MLVQLDEEKWEVSDTVQLEEVLANLSDRAEAQGRLVTQLYVGNRPMTDRELVPHTLSQVASSFGSIAATSERMESLVQRAGETGKEFGQQLRTNAQKIVEDFRQGRGGLRYLDQWFGQVADYLEWIQIQQSVVGSQSNQSQNLSHWVNELMLARQNMDEVRVADMLEYEVIPRLPQ
ncbi:MAG: hypothetical protein E4H32_00210 [Nitrospirales bacterium]|nr:MAG: hypothetical protein E4H32_00210 [Nitrospirales bacterium]